VKEKKVALPCTSEPVEVTYLDNEQVGGGPVFLMLHGLFDHKATWLALSERLTGARIVAPDLVGAGHSSKPLLRDRPSEYRYSLSMHRDYLELFARKLELSKFVLMGNSFGGAVAIFLYLTSTRFRRRTLGLVLVDTVCYPQTPPGYVSELAGGMGSLLRHRWLRALAFRAGFVCAKAANVLEYAFYDPSKVPPGYLDRTVEVLKTPNAFEANQLSARAVERLAKKPEVSAQRLREIGCPTLIVWGTNDRIVPLSFAHRLARELPGAELHTIERCGHAPQLEAPDELVRHIESWRRARLTPS
jgi:pimeloyl-ACP methyl ester carboxylesterase